MSAYDDQAPDLDNLELKYRGDGRLVLGHFEWEDGTSVCGTEQIATEGELPKNPPFCPQCALDLQERYGELYDRWVSLAGQFEIVANHAGEVLRIRAVEDPEPTTPRCRNCSHDADAHNRLGYCSGSGDDLRRPCQCPKWEATNA